MSYGVSLVTEAVSNRAIELTELPDALLSSVKYGTVSAFGVAFSALSILKGGRSARSNFSACEHLKWSCMLLKRPTDCGMKIVKPDIEIMELEESYFSTFMSDAILIPFFSMAMSKSKQECFWEARAYFLASACLTPIAKTIDCIIGVAAFSLAFLSGLFAPCYELASAEEIYNFALPYLASTNGIAYFCAALLGCVNPAQLDNFKGMDLKPWDESDAGQDEGEISRFTELTKLPDDILQSLEYSLFAVLGIAYSVLSLIKGGMSKRTNYWAAKAFDDSFSMLHHPLYRLIKIIQPDSKLPKAIDSYYETYFTTCLLSPLMKIAAVNGKSGNYCNARFYYLLSACISPVAKTADLTIGVVAALFSIILTGSSNCFSNEIEEKVYDIAFRYLTSTNGILYFCVALRGAVNPTQTHLSNETRNRADSCILAEANS